MKCKVNILKEIEIKTIRISLPVRYGEEDIPNDFPLRNRDMWIAEVNIDTGKINRWPDDPRFKKCHLHMKVCDSGLYELFDDSGEQVAKLSDYVPHRIVPGEYGDYVCLRIENGVITNWPKNPDVSAFFQD